MGSRPMERKTKMHRMIIAYICDSASKPFAFLLLVLKGQTSCPKDYVSPRGLCTGQIYHFLRVTGLLRVHARLHRSSCLFCLPRCRALRQPITIVEFKFVARQVAASVHGNTSSKTKICCGKYNSSLLCSTLILPQLATLYLLRDK